MGIKDWDPAEQPREKLLSHGAGCLSDAELLAIFLRTGCKGKSAVELGQELIDHFKGFRDLLSAESSSIKTINGLGVAKYVQLKAVMEMARRYLSECLARGQQLTSPADTRNYLLLRMRDYPHEVFACLFLDNKHRVIAYEEMFRGTIDSASVYPREIVKRALEHNAAALILAHNHPSGVCEPSVADRSITERIAAALNLVDIRLLDHLVVGDSNCLSFAETGLL
ncbi:MAG: DNA repair protein RadC [Gammaproteobacteria bacterium]|nr:DNA repair protein RadC [Gammaproteobacteria bacterium]